MKILILGGCAEMALPAFIELKKEEDVEVVTLADINEAGAREKAAEEGPKFRATKVDARDHAQVVELMKAHDVTMCFVGPFYVWERPLARAAIEAGRPYVSICDDYDAYLDVLTLDEEAKEAGVQILTGFGNSPGITQMLARKGYNSMEKPDKIHVQWCAGSDEAVGPTNLAHLFHIFNGTTLQWIDGREVRVRTGDGRRVVDFPEPIGRTPVFYTGHAESVSIPRNLPGLTEVTLHGGVKPPYIVGLVKAMSRLRLINTHARRTALAKLFHRIEGLFASEGIDRSVFRIDVYGTDKGRECHHYYTGVGHIAVITSFPCTVAALWAARGTWDDKPGGVYAAERILDDPDPFLDELSRRGIELHYFE